MTHEVLSARDIVGIVKDRFGAGVEALRVRDTGMVTFIVYGAFGVRADFDEYGRGNWGFSIALGGDFSVSAVLGEGLTILGSREQIVRALDTIDRYCRLRLGEEYLAALR